MKIKYKLKEVLPNIYHCEIKDSYDLTMTFCRIQEFYESPHKVFRNKKFKLLELMRVYAKDSGVFTYTIDWNGFNIPGKVIDRLYRLGIDDYNEYDTVIEIIHNKINKTIDKPNSYYLIATSGDEETINHEIRHGLFALNKAYKERTLSMLKTLNSSVLKKAKKALISLGYNKIVISDELQAYLSGDFRIIEEIACFNTREQKNILAVSAAMKENFKKFIDSHIS
jgi:hypothetical protein